MEERNLDALAVGPKLSFRSEFPSGFERAVNLSETYSGIDFILRSGRFVVGPWCYILRRKFWADNNFVFYPGISYEDTQLMGYALSKANKVAALTKFSCYNYIQRAGSIMNSGPTKQKLLSSAVIVNTHLQFAEEAPCQELSDWFQGSASGAFIDGINKVIRMGGDKVLLDEFLAAVHSRPTFSYGPGIINCAYQYFVLHYPRLYIELSKLIGRNG